MDTSIRKLLVKAEKFADGDKNPALLQAFNLLRDVAETRPTIDTPESCGQDLYVLCAEFAHQHRYKEIAKECIKMFFMKQPPANQFLCRAYLCQAQLLAPESTNDLEQLEKSIAYILKAILFAKELQRYHFLVFNASVVYWQICQPFLKPGYRQHLTHSLHQVLQALNEIDDSDHEWRAQIMITLIECCLDARHHSEASHVASTAAPFIKTNVPSLYKTIFSLMVQHNLMDTTKLLTDIQSSPELTLFYKICKLKNEKSLKGISNLSSEIQVILAQMGVLEKMNSVEKMHGSKSSHHTVSSYSTMSTHHTVSHPRTMSIHSTMAVTNPKGAIELDKNERPLLLLEVCRLCLEQNLLELATISLEAMKQCDVKEPGFHLELEFIECELLIYNLGEKQESYQKSVIDIRLEAIKRCEEAVMNAIRLNDPKVIQTGCVTLWNLCLSLLQPNLRHWVHKPLTLIAEALENIESLLVQMRCEVHLELARCHEDKEQVKVAMDNLKKALTLDVGNVYHERLENLLHRLELRAQLYKQPDRPEDLAAMMIEQARKVDSGTIKMKRSLLVKVGETLAPDAFLVVLDSENDNKEHSDGKESITNKLAGKAMHFNKCLSKADDHLKRLVDVNDKERARLWGDLAKIARKQKVWDVCRVACRFCLLYDDGRWRDVQLKSSSDSTLNPAKSKHDSLRDDEEVDVNKISSRTESLSSTCKIRPINDKDLNRMMAEVAFINGEAMIQLLRSENVQLNDKPKPPEDKRNVRKGSEVQAQEADPDWIYYCTWIKDLSELATNSFLHGMELGLELEEEWIVVNAATYIWNYNNHILSQGRHTEIVSCLTVVLEGLKKIGLAGETVMLLNICNALAQGLIKPWIPNVKELVKPAKEITSPKLPKGKGSKSPYVAQSKSRASSINDNSEAMLDVKKAIDICEYAMQVSNGNTPMAVVPIFQRIPILQTWVQAKQLAQQQISKQLGTDNESKNEVQNQMTKSIVAIEILSLNRNGLMEFKDVPAIDDVVQMVECTKWTDRLVELQVWTQLTYLAFEVHLHTLVMKCSSKALKFAELGTQPRNRKMDLHRNSVEQEMLGYTSLLLGQSLVENMQGKNSLHREALTSFLNSVKYARSAANYDLVMTAARHFWNASIPLVSQPIERELLREPLKIILECIAATASKSKKEKQLASVQSEEQYDADKNNQTTKFVQINRSDKEPKPGEKKIADVGMLNATRNKIDDDLTLRAAMYGVLLQSYADKGKWTEALEAIDEAIAAMPRTNHRLLIFKHRVMAKAKLGQPIHMDIQKFKDESEDILAHMWHRVALSSKEAAEQLTSYQYAIEALENETSCYQKVDYLLEFAQWLYSNQFSLEDVQDQLGWAIDILLNIKTLESQRK